MSRGKQMNRLEVTFIGQEVQKGGEEIGKLDRNKRPGPL